MGMTSPLCGLGSGKLGTPWARMQRAYSSAGSPPLSAGGGALAEPHAVVAATQIAASAARKRRAVFADRVLGAGVLLVASSFICPLELYGPPGNAGRTVAVTSVLHAVRDPPA